MNMTYDAGAIADQILQSEYLKAVMTPGLIAVLAAALLTCFLGLKVFRIWMGLAGLVLGLAAGYGIPVYLLELDSRIGIAVGIAAGILLAVLAYKPYLVSVLLYCWITGTVTAAAFLSPKGLLWWGICLGIGLIIGLIGLKLAEPVVILMTGISGGLSAASAVGALFAVSSQTILWIIGGALAVLGIALQFVLEGQKRGKQARKKAATIRNTKSVENEIAAARSIIDDDEE